MSNYILLAQSQNTADALISYLKILDKVKTSDADDKIIIDSMCRSKKVGCLSEAYKLIVSKIESKASEYEGTHGYSEITILVDKVNLEELRPLSNNGTWDSLIAMLILSFPEIRWVFGVMNQIESIEEQEKVLRTSITTRHGLDSLKTTNEYVPLFDPTGLRDWVRRRTRIELKGEEKYLPIRNKVVAAIDDEKSYAFFNGYTAFRFGYRVETITSWALMKERFGANAGKQHGYHILLEDMSLMFPDRPDDIHLLRLSDRCKSKNFPLLNSNSNGENSKYRILITTGQEGGEHGTLRINKKYLRDNKARDCGKIILKPSGGMHDLWEDSGFKNKKSGHTKLGFAKEFKWPPPGPEIMTEGGHGAPGRLTLISEVLLRRAEGMRDKVRMPEDYITAAVLATEASEILGGRTPTLTFAALKLKNEFEVLAETAFAGVGYHFGVKSRIQEIGSVVDIISKWFSKERQKKTALDARVSILNRIALVFQQAGQFEEEHECLTGLRSFHRKLQAPTGWSIRWISHGILRYSEALLSSFDRFLGAIAIWLTVFVSIDYGFSSCPDIINSIQNVFDSFFGFGFRANVKNLWVALFSITVGLAGILHMGILISLLYSLISRK